MASLRDILLSYANAKTIPVRTATDTKNVGKMEWMKEIFGFTDFGTQVNIFQDINSNLEKNAIIKEMLENNTLYNATDGSLNTAIGTYKAGWFISPTVEEITETVKNIGAPLGRPNIAIVRGKDIGAAQVEGNPYELFQGASQFNALEMIDIDITPYDGIGIYIRDNTQGPRTSLACAPGTFVRNYWVTSQLGGQFNALEKTYISHLNGYLVWGTDPEVIMSQLQPLKIMIPCMVYTQVAGATVENNSAKIHLLDKQIHQIYSSGVPINTYRNGGDQAVQLDIARAIIRAEYLGAIGMGIILHTIDKANGKTTLPRARINLTLLGAGVFNVPLDLVVNSLMGAIKKYERYSFDVYIHAYSNNTADTVKNLSGIQTEVPFGTNLEQGAIQTQAHEETGVAARMHLGLEPVAPTQTQVLAPVETAPKQGTRAHLRMEAKIQEQAHLRMEAKIQEQAQAQMKPLVPMQTQVKPLVPVQTVQIVAPRIQPITPRVQPIIPIQPSVPIQPVQPIQPRIHVQPIIPIQPIRPIIQTTQLPAMQTYDIIIPRPAPTRPNTMPAQTVKVLLSQFPPNIPQVLSQDDYLTVRKWRFGWVGHPLTSNYEKEIFKIAAELINDGYQQYTKPLDGGKIGANIFSYVHPNGYHEIGYVDEDSVVYFVPKSYFSRVDRYGALYDQRGQLIRNWPPVPPEQLPAARLYNMIVPRPRTANTEGAALNAMIQVPLTDTPPNIGILLPNEYVPIGRGERDVQALTLPDDYHSDILLIAEALPSGEYQEYTRMVNGIQKTINIFSYIHPNGYHEMGYIDELGTVIYFVPKSYFSKINQQGVLYDQRGVAVQRWPIAMQAPTI